MATPAKAKTVKKNGRPIIEMTEKDYKQICSMCAIQCTAEEIASVLDISVDTLGRRIQEYTGKGFADFFKVKRMGGHASLRRMQWSKAMSNDSTMLIWLGKQYLGQKDAPYYDNDSKPQVTDFEYTVIQ